MHAASDRPACGGKASGASAVESLAAWGRASPITNLGPTHLQGRPSSSSGQSFRELSRRMEGGAERSENRGPAVRFQVDEGRSAGRTPLSSGCWFQVRRACRCFQARDRGELRPRPQPQPGARRRPAPSHPPPPAAVRGAGALFSAPRSSSCFREGGVSGVRCGVSGAEGGGEVCLI